MAGIHIRYACAALLASLPSVGYGLDLHQAYQAALANDAAYRAAQYAYQSARLEVPLTRAARLPRVSLEGAGGEARYDLDDSNKENDITLTARMPLLDFGVNSEVRQGALRAASAAIAFDQAQDDLILRVAERYFQVLSAQDSREVARRQIRSIQRQRDFADERLQVGVGTETDLFDAEARLQQAKADLIDADIAIANADQALQQVLGDAPDALTAFAEGAPLQMPSPDSAAAWVENALRNNLSLLAADHDIEIAREEVQQQRATRRPRLGLEASRRRDDLSEFGRSYTDRVRATLSWTLYAGGALRYGDKQAALAVAAAQEAREDLRRQIEADTTAAHLAVTGALNRAQALGEAVRAGERALAAKEEGFRAGLTTNLDVLDAQRDLARSRTDYLRARYDFLLSVLRLERAVGDLDERDVQRVNDWLTAAQ